MKKDEGGVVEGQLVGLGCPCFSAGHLSGIQLAAAATETLIDSLYHYGVRLTPAERRDRARSHLKH